MHSKTKRHSELRSYVYDSNGIGASIDQHPILWTWVVAVILAGITVVSI